MLRHLSTVLPLPCLLLLTVTAGPLTEAAAPNRLEREQGRSETRVYSAPFRIEAGRSIADMQLLERLALGGYTRVHRRPESPGEFFYGRDVFWIYRREHRTGGRSYPPSLIGLGLDERDGSVTGLRDVEGRTVPLPENGRPWLEPVLLSESLEADRAERIFLDLAELPDHVWQPLVAMEDSRFFLHGGLDSRAIARAARANMKSHGITQGGSTLTQQLIKNRDLTSRRTLGRKLSEAARALMLEASYSKKEILQAYINHVYLGHVDGIAIYGYGAGARAYFSKDARDLTLSEAALLAAIVQGPNRLHPVRHPEKARERRNLVLARLQEEGWTGPEAVRAAKSSSLGVVPHRPLPHGPRHFLQFASAVAEEEAGSRLENGKGIRVETTLDPYLQSRAEEAVRRGLEVLRDRYPRLKGGDLSVALVALHAETGEVLAYVGGDPSDPADRFDRVRNGRRQPGSTVKPFVLLEALDDCGSRDPLTLSTRVADRPLTLDLPSGPWRPENHDRAFLGDIDIRRAMAESRNVPLVRIARHCGMDAVADRLREAGLPLPDPAPPSFVLGSVETTPLELARAYTVLATPGRVLEPFPVRRLERPGGRPLAGFRERSRPVARPSSAWLVRNTLRTAVESGTARTGALEQAPVAAKTGSSSELRDAWFAGSAGGVITVVWTGLDGGGSLGLGGAQAAAPIWRTFMDDAVKAYPRPEPGPPAGIAERTVDPKTGLLVRDRHPRGVREFFRRGTLPRRARFFRRDRPVPVVH